MPVAVRALPAAVAAAAALLGLIAAVAPPMAIALVVGGAFATVMLADITVGVCMFAFSAAFFEVIPSLGGVSFAKVTGLILGLSWLATLAVRHGSGDQLFSRHPGYTALAAVLMTWLLSSMLWAEDSSRTMSDALRLLLNLALVPIFYTAVRTTRDLRLLCAAFLAGVGLSAAWGMFVAGAASDPNRLSGAGEDPNYLAVWLVIGATMAFGLAAAPRARGGERGAALVAVVLLGAAMLATASRTGLVALAAVCVTGVLFAGRGRRLPVAAVVVVGLTACVLYVAALAPQPVRDRITNPGGGSGRTDIWAVAGRMIDAHPVTGVGLGNFQVSSIHYLLEPGALARDEFVVDTPKVAHNVYLEMLAEVGVVGFVLYVAVVGFSLLCAWRAARAFAGRGDRDSEVLARALLIAMFALLAGSFFVSIQYAKTSWMLIALGPVLLALARRGDTARGTA